MRTCVAALLLSALLFLAGCDTPAQTYWSPDGTLAAYIPSSGGPLRLFDQNGKIIVTFGETIGGVAWSADSKRLYLAQQMDRSTRVPVVERSMRARNADPDTLATTTRPSNADGSQMVVGYWENSAFVPLFSTGSWFVTHMALSPDQTWLAFACINPNGKDDEKNHSLLQAYSIKSRRLYLLAFGANPEAFAFSGPRRLAYAEPLNVVHGQISPLGQIVETELDDAAGEFARDELLGIATDRTPWMAAIGEDLLFTANPIALPILRADVEKERPKLYRYSRADKSLKVLVSDVGPFFAPSPDGKLILLEYTGKLPNGENADDLAVADAAAGQLHSLAPAKVSALDDQNNKTSGIAAFAAWRSSDQISFLSPLGADKPAGRKDNLARFDLGLYQLTADFQLKPIRPLSTDWPLEAKPFLKFAQGGQ